MLTHEKTCVIPIFIHKQPNENILNLCGLVVGQAHGVRGPKGVAAVGSDGLLAKLKHLCFILGVSSLCWFARVEHCGCVKYRLMASENQGSQADKICHELKFRIVDPQSAVCS